jgi:signal transduction histidine kinase
VSIFSESPASYAYIHLAELVLGILLYFVFRHFSQLYRRKFLYTWALSWLHFSVYMFCSALVFWITREDSLTQLCVNVISQFTCFMQVVMILRGTHEMVSEKAMSRRKFRQLFVLFLVISIITVVAYSEQPGDASQNHLLRLGSRSLTTGLGFLITGIVVWFHKKFSKGFGQRLLAASCFIYSFYQLHIFMVVLLQAMTVELALPSFYGISDVLLISLMGMSMVMWLLEDERQKLEKAHKELDRFLYSTSHDLRAPIASILGLTYLGKLEFGEEKARMFMGMIEERIKKLDGVISDILSLSRTKKFEIKIEPVRLRDLMDDVVADIKFNKNASSIKLDYLYDPTHVFRSDYSQMKIILCNLMGNAVKYHNLDQANPFIKVTFARFEDYVEICIEDNGQGIPEGSLPQIFEMFYRASINTEGTGLGLYIVNEALSKVKGSISVESTFGKGSAFKIQLLDA